MSKRVLSIALAVLMVLSVVSVSAFAVANPATGSVGFVTTTTAQIGQASGNVDVDIYYIFPADFNFTGYMHQIGNIVLGYNSAKYEYVANSRVYDSSLADILKDEGGSPTVISFASATGLAKTLSPNRTVAEQGYGYDAAAQIKLATDTSNPYGYGSSTGFPVVADSNKMVHVCTVKFKVLAALTANDVIGVYENSVNNQSKIQYRDGSKNAAWNAVVSGVAVPQAAVEIKKVAVQGQYVDEAKTAWNVGIKGEFDTFTADDFNFVDKISQKVTEVGVKVTVGDDTTAYTTGTVYLVGSKYQFRAVIKNIPVDSTDEVTVEFYATKSGSPVSGEKFTLNFADEYTAFAGRWADAQ